MNDLMFETFLGHADSFEWAIVETEHWKFPLFVFFLNQKRPCKERRPRADVLSEAANATGGSCETTSDW